VTGTPQIAPLPQEKATVLAEPVHVNLLQRSVFVLDALPT
jgi:hypothetical protein